MSKKQKKMLCRIVITVVLLVAFRLILPESILAFPFYLAIYLIIGYDILKKAIRGILRGRVFDENFLMAVATVGAFALSFWEKDFHCTEGVAVMLFYQTGELFQSVAVGRSRKNIGELMDIRPDYANLEQNGKTERVSPETVPVGSIIVVNPGEKIPIDGCVTEGTSALDTAALTGESVPVSVTAGSAVVSGSINMSGVLKIRTEKLFGQSTASKILELVENAGAKKSRSEKFIARFSRIYTPAVCGFALALAVLPPVIRLFSGLTAGFDIWVYRALTFLVTSCPCALVISIPLTFFAGIGGASHEGILVKGSDYLEILSKVKTVVFDKTGTLTKGVFEVTGVHHSPYPDEKLLEYAALTESASSHPIGLSLKKAYGKELDLQRVTEIRELGGKGITARVDGKPVAVGNARLMESLGVPFMDCHSAGTVIHIAIDREYAGHIVISDVIKSTSAEAIRKLHAAGISKTVILTGDSRKVADSVAQTLRVSECFSELLPEDKVNRMEQLLTQNQKGQFTAFVGDGINDAPVLTRADVGIAMGAIGSDAAIEAADVVLMDDDPAKLSKAIRISQKTLGIAYQNIWFAIGIKLACLILAATGLAGMWLAVFADVGVMVLAVLNAIRALNVKKL